MAKEVISQELLDKIEANSSEIEKTVSDITSVYSDELDEYVRWVRQLLRESDSAGPITDTELDDIVMNLSTIIYFTSTGCEQLGIREDISRSAYKEAYNTARSMLSAGTVADKNAEAEIQTLQERIVEIIFSRSYKILKAKVENAQELLASAKKIISRRVSEYELSRIQVNK